MPSAQKARSNWNQRQLFENKPFWLRAKLLKQTQNTAVEDLFIFARKELSILNLCKTDDSVMGAFIEMGTSLTVKVAAMMKQH